jgi:hypothetical protein
MLNFVELLELAIGYALGFLCHFFGHQFSVDVYGDGHLLVNYDHRLRCGLDKDEYYVLESMKGK